MYNVLPFFEAIMNRVVNVCKKILQHVKEYCQEAAIHGPQHIVSPRLAIFERLVLLPLLYISLYFCRNLVYVEKVCPQMENSDPYRTLKICTILAN